MCTLVNTPDGDSIGTVAELRRICPVIIPSLPGRAGYEPLIEDACLCQVDVAATAAANGIEVRHDRTFDEFWILESKEAT